MVTVRWRIAMMVVFLACLSAVPGWADQTLPAGPYRVTASIAPEPVPVGKATVTIVVEDPNGSPIPGAQVFAKADMPSMPMGLGYAQAQAVPAAAGQYSIELNFGMAGEWAMDVRVEGPRGSGMATFTVNTGSAFGGSRQGRPFPWVWVAGLLAAGLIAWFLVRTIVSRRRRGESLLSSWWTPRRLMPLGLLVLLLVLVFWVTGLLPRTGGGLFMPMETAPPGGAVPVAVETATPGLFRRTVTYTGSIEPLTEETVYPRVTGMLADVRVYPGDRVVAGEEVARLDDAELAARAAEASYGAAAGGAEAQAARDQAKAAVHEVHHATAGMQKAEADARYWNREIDRSKTLLKEGAISQEEFDREQAQTTGSRADVDHAQAELERSRSMLAAAKAEQAAAAARSQATAEGAAAAAIVHGYTRLTARNNGVVTRRLIGPGTLVSPGMAVLTIADLHQVRVQVNVPEQDLAGIDIGTPMDVEVADKNGAMTHRTLRVTSRAHRLDPESRTEVIEAIADNQDGAWLPGQYVVATFVVEERPDLLTVPAAAVTMFNRKPAVWLLQQGRAVRRVVTLGPTNGERTVITKGLASGEVVLTRGIEGLVEGASVIVAPVAGDEEVLIPENYQPVSPPESPTSTPSAMPAPSATPTDMPGMPGMSR